MKRFLISAVAATMVATLVPAAHAAGPTTGASFTVSAALTSQCRLKPADAGQTLSFAYNAFDPDTAQTGAGITVTFECTRGLAGVPTVVFDDDGVAGTKVGGTAAAAAVTGTGIAAGLRYEITATKGAPGAGTAATAGSGGTAATIPYAITGRIFGGQAGDSSI